MKNATDFIGKKVKVIIDRPLGSKHLKFNFVYPINYGYIKNTISGDGEELDAYCFSNTTTPLKSFTGTVVAVIHRTNDNDDKLIVTNKTEFISNQEIYDKTNFQEQYFESVILR